MAARSTLRAAHPTEPDPEVVEEIALALVEAAP